MHIHVLCCGKCFHGEKFGKVVETWNQTICGVSRASMEKQTGDRGAKIPGRPRPRPRNRSWGRSMVASTYVD